MSSKNNDVGVAKKAISKKSKPNSKYPPLGSNSMSNAASRINH